MAIDSAAKRFSVINLLMPFRGSDPLPDGSVGAPDRLHLALLYCGIAAGLPISALVFMTAMHVWGPLET
jgi:hypothetical protein